MNRRLFCSALASLASSSCLILGEKPWKIGVCDWNIKTLGMPAGFKVARELGLDGLQLSYTPRHEIFDLRNSEIQQLYLSESQKYKVEIASMAMGVLNQKTFATDSDSFLWADECLEIMHGMNQKIVLFAFFGKGNIKDRPDLQKNVINRLKKLAPKAEKYGMTIGLETWLNQEEHMHILDSVGSNSVKVYYDTANMLRKGYDIYQEIRWLGKKNAICQIHTKEVGNRLGQGTVDFTRVKEALLDIDYKDWLVMESAIKGDWKESYQQNASYLRTLFSS